MKKNVKWKGSSRSVKKAEKQVKPEIQVEAEINDKDTWKGFREQEAREQEKRQFTKEQVIQTLRRMDFGLGILVGLGIATVAVFFATVF